MARAPRCSAPSLGHRPGSTQEKLCPLHGIRGVASKFANPIVPMIESELLSAACDINTSPRRLVEMLSTRMPVDVRVAAAENPTLPRRGALLAVKDDDPDVRFAGARNPFLLPEDVRALVLNDQEDASLTLVALCHPACPVDLLELAAENGTPDVDVSVASNPSCPASIMRKFFDEDDIDVLASLLQNPFCPADLVDRAFERSTVGGGVIKGLAVKHPNLSERRMKQVIDEDNILVMKMKLCSNPSLPGWAIERLTSEPEVGHQALIAVAEDRAKKWFHESLDINPENEAARRFLTATPGWGSLKKDDDLVETAILMYPNISKEGQ